MTTKSKKNFKTSFDDLIGGKVRQSETSSLEKTQIATIETRATFVVKGEHYDKVKAISYMERKMIKDIVAEAFAKYITEYELINGDVILPKN